MSRLDKVYPNLINCTYAAWAFCMVVFPRQIGFAILALLALFIFGTIKKQLKFEWTFMSTLMVLLYAGYGFGALYTNHPDIAAKYLEYKSALLLFPLLIAVKPKTGWNINFPIFGFLLGMFVAINWGIISVSGCLLTTHWHDCLDGGKYSNIHHPSYFAIYCTVALILIWRKGLWGEWKWAWILKLLLSALFIVGTFLTFSLAGMLFFVLMSAGFALYFLLKKWKWKGALLAAAIPVLGFVTISKLQPIQEQLEVSKIHLNHYLDNPTKFILSEKTYLGGNQIRLILWTASTELFVRNPFGVGTGNVDDAMRWQLERYTHYELAKRNYNPHNQFLQTGIEIGWFWTLVFLLIIIRCIQLGWKYKEVTLIILGSILFVNCLLESVWQRHSGIVFFVFMMCLFAGEVKRKGAEMSMNDKKSIE